MKFPLLNSILIAGAILANQSAHASIALELKCSTAPGAKATIRIKTVKSAPGSILEMFYSDPRDPQAEQALDQKRFSVTALTFDKGSFSLFANRTRWSNNPAIPSEMASFGLKLEDLESGLDATYGESQTTKATLKIAYQVAGETGPSVPPTPSHVIRAELNCEVALAPTHPDQLFPNRK